MTTPLVSIAILTYNHEKYIGKTLDNILCQKVNFYYEIIIGEDCSTDLTREIILDYRKRFPELIKIITSDSNVGATKNQKRTIAACQGKYLAFCEGDDFWTIPHKLQMQIDFLEKNNDYGMVHTDANYLYQIDKKIVKNYNKINSIHFPSGKIFNQLLSDFYFIVTATVVVRRELFINAFNCALFIEKQWLLNDLPIWLEIATKTQIGYLDESTATYRLHNESASRTKDLLKHHKFHLSVFNIRYYFWEKYSKDQNIKKNLDTAYYNMMIGDSYKMENINIAKIAFKEMKENGIKKTPKQWIKYLFLNFTNLLAML